MGNFLPCLSHGANRKLLHGWKKANKQRRDHTANASDRLEKGEKGVIRVKVVLTKEEAARLLSMCVGDEEKTTLTQLLSQLESRHESGVTLGSSHGGWRPVLESIAEDC